MRPSSCCPAAPGPAVWLLSAVPGSANATDAAVRVNTAVRAASRTVRDLVRPSTRADGTRPADVVRQVLQPLCKRFPEVSAKLQVFRDGSPVRASETLVTVPTL